VGADDSKARTMQVAVASKGLFGPITAPKGRGPAAIAVISPEAALVVYGSDFIALVEWDYNQRGEAAEIVALDLEVARFPLLLRSRT